MRENKSKNKSLRYYIISKENSTTLYIIMSLYVVISVISLILYILFSYYNFSGVYKSISLYLPLALLFLLIVASIIFRKKLSVKKKGILIFDTYYIEIYLDKKNIKYPIKQISDLLINYDGYDGEPEFSLPLGAFTKTGCLNNIKFTYNDKKYYYEFESTDYRDRKYLRKLINNWKQDGVNITFNEST